ncbi:MAG: PorP/SprF family type IX secretion system membrane protein [Bacteroidetes bacterium]|nr:PorP/SprF family type IX secretion system membrane protein [Bacteroidota bacterium]
MNLQRTLLGIFFVLLFASNLMAQDIHFSQFYASPLTLNPGLTGLNSCDYRVAVIYRDQWKSVIPNSYKTVSASFDTKVLREKLNNDFVGVGVMFYNDRSGDAGYQINKIMASAAYHKGLSVDNSQNLSLGVQFGFTQESLELTKLLFPSQFVGGIFTDRVSSGEPGDLNNGNTYLDLQAGLMWYGEFTDQVSGFAGISMFHITTPKQTFFKEAYASSLPGGLNELPSRYVFTGGSKILVSDNFSVLPNFIYMNQKKAQELNVGASVEYDMPDNENPETFVSIGGWYRLKDAVIVTTSIGFQNWILGVSYDINTSQLRSVSRNQGGFELSLIYVGCYGQTKPREIVVPCPRL